MRSSLEDWTPRNDDDEYIVDEKNEIIPGLWLGAQPLTLERDYRYVISLNGAIYHDLSHHRTVTTLFADGPVLPPIPYLYALADMGLKFLADGPTLIHCKAGKNRSGLIMGLMLLRGGHVDSARAAVDLMRAKRGRAVLHNPVFREWLLSHDDPSL